MKVRDFYNAHKGARCFIACNGPSLNNVPWHLLDHEIVIALNRGYLHPEVNQRMIYCVTADKRIERSFSNEIANLPCPVFSNSISAPNTVNYWLKGGKFSTQANKGVRLGHSVTVVALQFAFYMGFDAVYLVGCDHKIVYDGLKRTDGRQFIQQGNDPNHFTDDYYPDGYEFRYQNLDAVAHSYAEARRVYKLYGRVLKNATPESHLPESVLQRTSVEEVMEV